MTPTPDSHPWMVRRYCVQRPGESGYTAHPCVSRAAALEIFSVKFKPGETMVELLKWETPSNGGSGRHPWLRTVGVRRRRLSPIRLLGLHGDDGAGDRPMLRIVHHALHGRKNNGKSRGCHHREHANQYQSMKLSHTAPFSPGLRGPLSVGHTTRRVVRENWSEARGRRVGREDGVANHRELANEG